MPVERGRTLQLLLGGPEISDKELFASSREWNALKLFWLHALKDIDFEVVVVDRSFSQELIANFCSCDGIMCL